ncbi:DUF4231 domain-containing protein [Prolixibacteraceae bacterium JC049]|nr:DUF4231 domain-containing protein [Prolixibacteraceae bacterium JC049]
MGKTKIPKSFLHYEKLIEESKFDESYKIRLRIIWLDYMIFLNKRAKRDLISKNFLQIAILISGVCIPVISNLPTNSWFNEPFRIGTLTILGLTSAFAVAMLSKFSLEERWVHYRQNTEIMRLEGESFFISISNDENIDLSNKKLNGFLNQITAIKKTEFKQYFINAVNLKTKDSDK